MLTKAERLRIILTNLENYGWQLRYVDDGNGSEQPVKGLTAEDRAESATEMITDIGDGVVTILNPSEDCLSYIVITPSTKEGWVLAPGTSIIDLDLSPTDEQELADFVAQYHVTS